MKLSNRLGAFCAGLMLFALPAAATEQASYVLPAAGPMNMATFVGTYLNPALRAIASCHWGPSSPTNGPGSAPIPYQCWVNTTTNPSVLSYWDGTNWVTAAKIDTSAHAWTPSRQGTDLGTAAIATTGASGHAVPFLDVSNTWSAIQLGATAAVDTSTTQFATTAFVIGQAASATPLIDGTAAVGTSTRFARADHVHPTDSTRAPLASPALTGTPTAPTASPGTNSTQLATTAYADAIAALKANLASPALTGTPTAPTAAVDTNTTQLATTAYVIGQAASATPLIDGTAAVGSSTRFARADHVHPTDTSRLAVTNNLSDLNNKAMARAFAGLNIDSLCSNVTCPGDTNYTILSTDRGVYHTALSAARTDTLPAANSVNPGQEFHILDFAGVASATKTITLQRAGSDTINGVTSVVAINAQFGAGIFWSDGVSRWTFQPTSSGGGGGTVTQVACNGVTITSTGTCPPSFGFQNCSLAASAASNLLTVALKDNAGNDPSASSPCNLWFRNVTASTGSWTQVTVTAALSISTNVTGATLGSSNSTAFRFWVEVFNNGGTPVLALFNAVSYSSGASASIFPLNEGAVASSTPISGSATSAGVFYTPNGTTVTNKAFLILGYVEYNSTGLTTAGTYASGPNFIQTFGPGIRKPGEIVQPAFAVGTGATQTATIIPTSAANPIRAFSTLSGSATVNNNLSNTLKRTVSAVTTTLLAFSAFEGTSNAQLTFSVGPYFDLPNTTSSTAYTGNAAAGAGLSISDLIIEAWEIQG
jgi:hypothetical protein